MRFNRFLNMRELRVFLNNLPERLPRDLFTRTAYKQEFGFFILKKLGPGDLKIGELLDRLAAERFTEIIIATDFNTEGEATALYLLKVLKASGVKLTRVAYGIPVGSDLEYADQATIAKAFEGRREFKS